MNISSLFFFFSFVLCCAREGNRFLLLNDTSSKYRLDDDDDPLGPVGNEAVRQAGGASVLRRCSFIAAESTIVYHRPLPVHWTAIKMRAGMMIQILVAL